MMKKIIEGLPWQLITMNKLTYALELQSGYEKEGTFAVISKAMNKEIFTGSKVTPNLSEISNNLLKSEQNSSLPMLNFPPKFCTDTSISQIASNITIRSGCKFDVCFREYDKEFLSILEEIQCSLNNVKSRSQISASSVVRNSVTSLVV